MREKPVLDLSRLPLHGSGQASPTWWGTSAFRLIEVRLERPWPAI
jgi:hypothetical protein